MKKYLILINTSSEIRATGIFKNINGMYFQKI